MIPLRFTATLALAAVQLTVFGTLRADDNPEVRANEKQSVNVCIVSGEHLQPGEIVTYVHKEAGLPDRTLRFCCRKCLARFKANPELYLKKLDELESGKTEKGKDRTDQ